MKRQAQLKHTPSPPACPESHSSKSSSSLEHSADDTMSSVVCVGWGVERTEKRGTSERTVGTGRRSQSFAALPTDILPLVPSAQGYLEPARERTHTHANTNTHLYLRPSIPSMHHLQSIILRSVYRFVLYVLFCRRRHQIIVFLHPRDTLPAIIYRPLPLLSAAINDSAKLWRINGLRAA